MTANIDASATGAKTVPAAGARETAPYVLRLYITGVTPNSTRAVVNLRRFCEQHLSGRYNLDIVDISQHPSLAADEQIVAAPTLVKMLPLPRRRFIGDMSQTATIMRGFDLRQAVESPPSP